MNNFRSTKGKIALPSRKSITTYWQKYNNVEWGLKPLLGG